MHNYSWSCYLFNLEIHSDKLIDINNFYAHIPDLKATFVNGKSSLKIIISTNHKKCSFIENKESLVFNFDEKYSQYDLPHLLYNILRSRWIEKSIFPVHSIVFNNNLVIGHSGTGKTTLALGLMDKKISVFSFDKTLLSFQKKLVAVGATKFISIRKGLRNKISNAVLHENEERLVIKSLDDLSEQIIDNIYFLITDNNELKIESLDSLSALHRTYPYFLDIQKQVTLLAEGDIIYDPFIDQNIKNMLAKQLKNVLTTVPCHVIMGKTHDMVEYFRGQI